MASFTSIVALLLVLAAMAEASIYRTTVVTTETIDNIKNSYKSQCSQEIEKYPIKECKKYMQQCVQREGLFFSSVGNSECDQVPEQCCRSLRQMKDECKCQSLKQMAEQMQESEEEMKQKMALSILSKCYIPIMSCQYQELVY